MTVDQARAAFQEQLDWTLDDETLDLDRPRERPGPVVVRNRITVDGKGCTVWAMAGPVVTVESDNVAFRNLRIESTANGTDAGPDAGVALRVTGGGLTLDNVTVRGSVVGLPAEEGDWRYPHQLNLGALAHGTPHEMRVRLVVPVPCQLTSEISGLDLSPQTLAPGAHEVRIGIEEMLRDTLVVGTIGIKTAFLRREIVLNAHVLAPAEGLPEPAREQNRVVWQPTDWDALLADGVKVKPASTPVPASRPTPPPPPPAARAPVPPTSPAPVPSVPTPPRRPTPTVPPPPPAAVPPAADARPASTPAPVVAVPIPTAKPLPPAGPTSPSKRVSSLPGALFSPPASKSAPPGLPAPPGTSPAPSADGAPPPADPPKPPAGLPAWVKPPKPPGG